MACLYFSFAIMSLFAAQIVAKLHPRYVFLLAATLRVIWEASFILPSVRYHRLQAGEKAGDITSWILQIPTIEAISLITALISGCGSAITWVGHGYYIALCANERNKGRFNAYSWILFNI